MGQQLSVPCAFFFSHIMSSPTGCCSCSSMPPNATNASLSEGTTIVLSVQVNRLDHGKANYLNLETRCPDLGNLGPLSPQGFPMLSPLPFSYLSRGSASPLFRAHFLFSHNLAFLLIIQENVYFTLFCCLLITYVLQIPSFSTENSQQNTPKTRTDFPLEPLMPTFNSFVTPDSHTRHPSLILSLKQTSLINRRTLCS